MQIDLEAYLGRIGYGGAREPTLEVLRELHSLHPAAIPFENLDPLLGRPVSLDLQALQSKLVDGRRGGYCFEQNALFRAALEALGFDVTPLIARVVWMAPPERPLGPRNHMLLGVDLPEGPYIADVGFGGQLVSAPLALNPGLEQTTAQAVLRVETDGDARIIETLLPSGWAPVYRFSLEPAELSDYEMSNWFTSTHPGFLLTTNLLAERLTPTVRVSCSIRSSPAVIRTAWRRSSIWPLRTTLRGRLTKTSPSRRRWTRRPCSRSCRTHKPFARAPASRFQTASKPG